MCMCIYMCVYIYVCVCVYEVFTKHQKITKNAFILLDKLIHPISPDVHSVSCTKTYAIG